MPDSAARPAPEAAGWSPAHPLRALRRKGGPRTLRAVLLGALLLASLGSLARAQVPVPGSPGGPSQAGPKGTITGPSVSSDNPLVLALTFDARCPGMAAACATGACGLSATGVARVDEGSVVEVDDGMAYEFRLDGAGQHGHPATGEATVYLAAGSCTGQGGVGNAAATFTLALDHARPRATLLPASFDHITVWEVDSLGSVGKVARTRMKSLPLRLNFSEPVGSLDPSFLHTNGPCEVRNLMPVAASADPGGLRFREYTCDLVIQSEGAVSVRLLEGAGRDAAGNPTQGSVRIELFVDHIPPRAQLDSPMGSKTIEEWIVVTLHFTELMPLVGPEDLKVAGANVSAVVPRGEDCTRLACRAFDVLLRAPAAGIITVRLGQNVSDLAANPVAGGEKLEVRITRFKGSLAGKIIAGLITAAVVLSYAFAAALAIAATFVPAEMNFPGRDGHSSAGNLLGMVYHLQVFQVLSRLSTNLPVAVWVLSQDIKWINGLGRAPYEVDPASVCNGNATLAPQCIDLQLEDVADAGLAAWTEWTRVMFWGGCLFLGILTFHIARGGYEWLSNADRNALPGLLMFPRSEVLLVMIAHMGLSVTCTRVLAVQGPMMAAAGVVFGVVCVGTPFGIMAIVRLGTSKDVCFRGEESEEPSPGEALLGREVFGHWQDKSDYSMLARFGPVFQAYKGRVPGRGRGTTGDSLRARLAPLHAYTAAWDAWRRLLTGMLLGLCTSTSCGAGDELAGRQIFAVVGLAVLGLLWPLMAAPHVDRRLQGVELLSHTCTLLLAATVAATGGAEGEKTYIGAGMLAVLFAGMGGQLWYQWRLMIMRARGTQMAIEADSTMRREEKKQIFTHIATAGQSPGTSPAGGIVDSKFDSGRHRRGSAGNSPEDPRRPMRRASGGWEYEHGAGLDRMQNPDGLSPRAYPPPICTDLPLAADGTPLGTPLGTPEGPGPAAPGRSLDAVGRTIMAANAFKSQRNGSARGRNGSGSTVGSPSGTGTPNHGEADGRAIGPGGVRSGGRRMSTGGVPVAGAWSMAELTKGLNQSPPGSLFGGGGSVLSTSPGPRPGPLSPAGSGPMKPVFQSAEQLGRGQTLTRQSSMAAMGYGGMGGSPHAMLVRQNSVASTLTPPHFTAQVGSHYGSYEGQSPGGSYYGGLTPPLTPPHQRSPIAPRSPQWGSEIGNAMPLQAPMFGGIGSRAGSAYGGGPGSAVGSVADLRRSSGALSSGELRGSLDHAGSGVPGLRGSLDQGLQAGEAGQAGEEQRHSGRDPRDFDHHDRDGDRYDRDRHDRDRHDRGRHDRDGDRHDRDRDRHDRGRHDRDGDRHDRDRDRHDRDRHDRDGDRHDRDRDRHDRDRHDRDGDRHDRGRDRHNRDRDRSDRDRDHRGRRRGDRDRGDRDRDHRERRRDRDRGDRDRDRSDRDRGHRERSGSGRGRGGDHADASSDREGSQEGLLVGASRDFSRESSGSGTRGGSGGGDRGRGRSGSLREPERASRERRGSRG